VHTFVVMVTPRPTTLYGPTSGRNGALNVPSVWPAPAAGSFPSRRLRSPKVVPGVYAAAAGSSSLLVSPATGLAATSAQAPESADAS
jgi:hypothetical protein